MKIINVMAVSLDGKTTEYPLQDDISRKQSLFAHAEDFQHVQGLIYTADAVISGADSIRTTNVSWLQKNHRGVFPAWYVLTTKGLEEDLPFWKANPGEKILVTPHAIPNPNQENTRILYYRDSVVQTICEDLKQRNAKNVVLFGGGKVNFLFYKAKAVDELFLTLAPVLVGRKDVSEFVAGEGLEDIAIFKLLSVRKMGEHVLLHYASTPSEMSMRTKVG